MKTAITLLSFFFLLFLSCSKDNNNDKELLLGNYIESDKELVRKWIFEEYNPKMNPSLEFDLIDITTTDIQNKLNARVYAIEGLGNTGVFIKDSTVFDLGRYNLFGASQPENLTVTDLDNDNHYELFFTLTQGSGVLRTNIVCYINDLDDKYLLGSGTFLMPLDYTIGLKKNNTHLDITYKSGSTRMDIGEVTIANEDNELRCLILLKENLPKSVLDDIAGN